MFVQIQQSILATCFFGDGATAQGLWYEVMNMAALWKLPVIYACENNGYSEYTRTDEIAARAVTLVRDREAILPLRVEESGKGLLVADTLPLGERVTHDHHARASRIAGAERLGVPAEAALYDTSGGTWVYLRAGQHEYRRERVDIEFTREDIAYCAHGPARGTEVVTAGAAELFGFEFGVGK